MMSHLCDLAVVVRYFVRRMHPAQQVTLGYAAYIAVGWGLLCLPWSRTAVPAGMLDHLFIATSAVSTTGLSTISVADCYTFFGQLVVLALIQLGGVGYMTFGSCIVLARKQVLSRNRVNVGKAVFTLPDSFDLRHFLRVTVAYTLIVEGIGAAALYGVFRSEGVPDAGWSAVFHSVSSFCTAGFSLYNSSFEGYAGHMGVNAVVSALSIAGAIGFIVAVDFWNRLTGRVAAITLTSRIILVSTAILLVVGTTLLFLQEPTIQARPFGERGLAAFFQAMTAMTTVGFNTIPIGALSKASILLLVVLMVIGSSPSGTGGGLKCTTITAFIGIMRGALRGEETVRFWNRPIPPERLWTAAAGVGFYVAVLIAGTYLLDLTETAGFDQLLFEAASALGTVGLSMGITAALTVWGKVTIIALMFCGRISPLMFGLAFFAPDTDGAERPNNDFAV